MEDWSEIEDDAVEEVSAFESPKEKTPRSGKLSKKHATKEHSKKQQNDIKEKSKRRKSRDHPLKKQKSREDHSPTKTKSLKVKTPDKEHAKKRIDSHSRKVSAKQQEPPRYDNFLKASSSCKKVLSLADDNTQASNSPSGECSTFSAAVDQKPPKKSSISRKYSQRIKQTSVINRSCSSTKIRRKSSARIHSLSTNAPIHHRNEILKSKNKPLTRSNSKLRAHGSSVKPTSSSRIMNQRNLKRSVAKTSLEESGNKNTTNNIDCDNIHKAKRIKEDPSSLQHSDQLSGSLLSDTVDTFMKNSTHNESIVTPSPSPFVIESDHPLRKRRTTRLCPLGIRGEVGGANMMDSFLTQRSGRPMFSPVPEISDSDVFIDDQSAHNLRPNTRRLRRESNFKLVRLNSIKNKRRSMLRSLSQY